MTNEPEQNDPVEQAPSDPAPGEEVIGAADSNDIEVRSPEFQELNPTAATESGTEIDRLHEIKVVVSAELGRTEIPIQKLLSLGPGSVLELERSIDSPVELVTQGVPLAKGEVVVVNDCFAIRVTEIYQSMKQKQAG